MFNLLTNLAKAATGAVVLPVSVLADIVTLPASAYDNTNPWESTEKRVNQISDAVDNALK